MGASRELRIMSYELRIVVSLCDEDLIRANGGIRVPKGVASRRGLDKSRQDAGAPRGGALRANYELLITNYELWGGFATKDNMVWRGLIWGRLAFGSTFGGYCWRGGRWVGAGWRGW